MKIANRTMTARRFRLAAAISALALQAAPVVAAPAVTVDIIDPGTFGQNFSLPTISADGRYVAYKHVRGSSNAEIEVFDRVARTSQVVSLNAAGQEASGGSVFAPVISADGRYVLFASRSPNMDVPAGGGGYFLYDRQNHSIETVVNAAGGTVIQSLYAAMSSDGRYIAYRLRDPADSSNTLLYVRDRVNKTTTQASGATTLYIAGSDDHMYVSDDGRYITYRGKATSAGHFELVMHDRVSGVTEAENVNSAGVRENAADANPRFGMSADGKIVVFASAATNLASPDTNGALDVFVRDRSAGTTTKVSYGPVNGPSGTYGVAVSGDGRYVSFTGYGIPGSTAFGVFRLDRQTNIARITPLPSQEVYYPTLSATGRYVAFDCHANSCANYDFAVSDYGPPAALNLSATTLALTEGGNAGTYTIALNELPTANVLVNLTADTGLTLARSQLTFTSANWATPQVVSVQAVDDGVPQAPRSLNISQKTSSADPDFNAVAALQVSATVSDAVIPTIAVPAAAPPGSLALAGTSAAGATVTLTVLNQDDNSVGAYSALADSKGNWTLTLSGVVAGHYQFQANADGIQSALYYCTVSAQ